MPNPNLPNNPGYNLYVGARYVPIFSDVNNGVWTDSVAYEPLTIVTYLGDSYTSKTYVPAGIPPTNETYWAKTGNYNAQIETLNQKINSVEQSVSSLDGEVAQIDVELENLSNNTNEGFGTINADVSKLKISNNNGTRFAGKKVIFIGDSMSLSTQPAGGWQVNTANYLKCSPYYIQLNSAGFTRKSTSGTYVGVNFQEGLAQWISENPSILPQISSVIIAGGVNDTDNNASYEEFSNALDSLSVQIAKLPNASAFFMYNQTFSSYEGSKKVSGDALEASIKEHGIPYCNFISGFRTHPPYNSGDNLHLSADGCIAFAKAISQYVCGGNLMPDTDSLQITFNSEITSLYNNSYVADNGDICINFFAVIPTSALNINGLTSLYTLDPKYVWQRQFPCSIVTYQPVSQASADYMKNIATISSNGNFAFFRDNIPSAEELGESIRIWASFRFTALTSGRITTLK